MDMPVQNAHSLLVRVLLLYLCSQVCSQQCVKPCQCPSSVPTCPEGIPLVLDGCGCCQVCARQKGEACTDILVCDKQSGLKCDFSASFPGAPGECVSQDGLGCELNGKSYQEGEVFQPSCFTHCKCSGGGVICVPRCSNNVLLPSQDCPHPRRVQLPGKCCREWVCENSNNSVLQDAQTAHRRTQLLPALAGNQPSPAFKCIERSTKWSACSHNCDQGISTRISNQNPFCRLEQQVRLCMNRPCLTVPEQFPVWPKRCKSSYKSAVPTRLFHQDCYSAELYQLRYCGVCKDGRCCTPYQTSTITVPFHCPDGRFFDQAVMMISSCVCHTNCARTFRRAQLNWSTYLS